MCQARGSEEKDQIYGSSLIEVVWHQPKWGQGELWQGLLSQNRQLNFQEDPIFLTHPRVMSTTSAEATASADGRQECKSECKHLDNLFESNPCRFPQVVSIFFSYWSLCDVNSVVFFTWYWGRFRMWLRKEWKWYDNYPIWGLLLWWHFNGEALLRVPWHLKTETCHVLINTLSHEFCDLGFGAKNT